MTIVMTPPSVLSSPQRRCQVLLMLALPGQRVTTQAIRAMNGVDEEVARQDIADTDHEIQRYHRLNIASQQDGSYRIVGTTLDQRLCQMQWLRRGLRLCPEFISRHYTPALKSALRQRGVARTLYDDTNLRALINLCSRRLQRSFECHDIQFLRLCLQYCLLQSHAGFSPQFNPEQHAWTKMRDEYLAAHEIVRHWQRRVAVVPPANEHTYLALLFMMLRTPDPLNDCQQQDQRLQQAITQLVDRFRQLAGLRFSDERGLTAQLYTHIAQALDRNLFGIGIDNSLQEEIERLYPRLIRTTREALVDLETEYALRFSAEEAGLVAVIFGAWLMQDAELQEKQVVLITGHEPQREQDIELQLRELTLLPLNIKYLPVREFQKQGAPRDVTLIVTPYAIPLPLFSAPLIHTDQTLTDHQQLHIRAMLES